MPAVDSRHLFDVLKATEVGENLRVVAWAYKTRNADGSLVYDSGGTTKDPATGAVIDATDQDVIDTPEAEKALADSLYELVGSGKGTTDDMHETFGIGRVVGGLYVDDDVATALGVEKAIGRGAIVVFELPRIHDTAKKILSGERSQLSIVGMVEREELRDAA